MILVPFLAAVGNALGVVIDKITLSKYRVDLKIFYPILFVFLCFFTALFVPFLGKINYWLAFSNYYFLIFWAMIASAIIWNIFYYQGLQKENLYEFELIITLTPLTTTFLAALLLIEERNWQIFLSSAVASLALLFSHLKKDHFVFSKYSLGLLLAVFFISLEMVFQKILLNVYSPVSLYFIRTFIILVFFWLFFRPKIARLGIKNLGLIMLSAGAGVLQMVLKFYSFELFGVIYTTLIMTLAPILVYFTCILIFKEKLTLKTIFCGLIILACIIWATFK